MFFKSVIKKITPDFALSIYHLSWSFLAALWYGFPSESMIVIGVTGTKGKSSTVFMIARILEEAGLDVAVSSSLIYKIKKNEWLNPYHMTMVGRFRLQQFLAEAKKSGCKYAIIETTSEGIRQSRHRFINFDIALFTNLSPEHIESHGSFENYKIAKGKIFEALSASSRKTIDGKKIEKGIIVNADDENTEYFLKFKADKKYAFGTQKVCPVKGKEDRCFISSEFYIEASGASFVLEGEKISLQLLGEFNIYNALAAISCANILGVDIRKAKSALEKIDEVPGRLEFVRVGQEFNAIIDLAHTPSSYEALFKAVNLIKNPKGRIISVFGSAGGGRDKWKRPELGKIAAKNSDYIILTNEDPYDENPESILEDIKKGIDDIGFNGKCEMILDRNMAIKFAIEEARWSDTILFLGKGTEQTMIIGKEEYPWNEEELVMSEIKNLLYDRRSKI